MADAVQEGTQQLCRPGRVGGGCLLDCPVTWSVSFWSL